VARILFVAKDNGCASVTEQVAVLAREGGHVVAVAAEGLAMARFEKLGFNLRFMDNYRGMVDFRAPTEEEKGMHFNAVRYIDCVKPDIVVTGVGSPINIQSALAEAATHREIPLVICEDFWSKSPGHFDATKVRPTMILTVDNYSIELNKQTFPHVPMHVVGNPGVKDVDVPSTVQTEVEALRNKEGFDGVCVFAGGGPESILAELRLLMGCFEKTPGKWCVIPGFHPKYNKLKLEGMSKPYGEIWREYLLPFSDCVRYVKATTDQLAMCADLVASGFSTIMSTAVSRGVPAVCLNTTETMSLLLEHGKHYTEIPQVALDIVSEVKEPRDISFALTLPPPETIAEITQYDPKMAYEHICELLPK